MLVTGSGTGLGREIALEFARQGAHVAFHYSIEREGALQAVRLAQELGVKAAAFQADFRELAQVERLAQDASALLGRVDILVNNAGISFNRPFLKVEPAHYEQIYAVNVRAGFFLSQKLTPGMIAAGGGAICNIASIHALSGAPEHAVYAGTKGAIMAYTRALGVELAHKGIRVNAVAPGCIPVEGYTLADPSFTLEAAQQAAADSIPAGRFGYPIEVARLVVYLCSDAAAFIIGQTIVIDGGTTALMSLISDFRSEFSARFGQQYLSASPSL